MWVACSGDMGDEILPRSGKTVARVDPLNERVSSRRTVEEEPIDVAVAPGAVWARTHHGSVQRVGP